MLAEGRYCKRLAALRGGGGGGVVGVCCRTGLQVLMRLVQPMLLREVDYLHPRLPSNKSHLRYSPIPYWAGLEGTRVLLPCNPLD